MMQFSFTPAVFLRLLTHRASEREIIDEKPVGSNNDQCVITEEENNFNWPKISDAFKQSLSVSFLTQEWPKRFKRRNH